MSAYCWSISIQNCWNWCIWFGYGGILKQVSNGRECIVPFTSAHWNDCQKNYSTIKKEILLIVLCISKFQSDLLNQKFLLRIDCKSAKEVLQKDVQNIASKQIFARWQAILSIFDFEIEYIKGDTNSIPDFLTREFLQNRSWCPKRKEKTRAKALQAQTLIPKHQNKH